MKVRVSYLQKDDFKKLKKLQFKGLYYENYADIYLVPEELKIIDDKYFNYTIIIPDVNDYLKDYWKIREEYHSYEDIIATMDALVANYPSICKKIVYGTSVGGRELSAIVISDNVNTHENEAEIMFDSGIHGDEIIGPENMIRFAEYLCNQYGTDASVTELVDNREIWLYCMVNPDGRVNVTRENNNMVDLNRDAGYMWDAWGGSSGAFSQPESKALRDCMYDNQFVVHTTYHSGTEYISLPWSYRSSQCPDFDYIENLAGIYADSSNYPVLNYGQGNTGMYAINGSTKDTNYAMLGSISWSMEISYEKNLPASQIMQYFNYNLPAMLAMIRHAGYGVEGIVTDAVTGEPITATVFVGNNFPTYTDPEVGDFHKYLTPGTYSITIIANGYESETIENVVVTEMNATSVNFELTPIDNEFSYAFKVASCQIPGNNEADEGYTPAAFGEPDQINYSIGKNGWIVLDMQTAVTDGPGNDIIVYEGDNVSESYNFYISETADGPWFLLGVGNGTTEFDIAGAMNEARFFKISDDGDGIATANDAGFDLDAIQTLEHESGVYLFMDSYTVDDSQTGNGNGKIDPGETVDLIINLRNNGDIAANETSGIIITEDNFFSIVTGNAIFGDISAAQNAEAVFTITANETIPVGHILQIDLSVEANEGTVNENFDIIFVIGIVDEDWETGDFEQYYWNGSGNENWFITDLEPFEGTYCSQSGNIGHNQNSELSVTTMVVAEENISFMYKVSSESSYDFLKFYIDGNELASWSGQQSWTEQSFNVQSGIHSFSWTYSKDGSVSSENDCGWIDNIVFPPSLFLWADVGGNITINFDEPSCSLNANAINYSSVEWTTTGTGNFDNETELSSTYYPSDADIAAENLTLELTIYDDNANSFSDDLLLTIIPDGTEINKLTNKQNLSIFPLPNKGHFLINYTSEKDKNLSIEIINSLGKNVYSKTLRSDKGKNLFEINLENCKAGVYYVRIIDEFYLQTKKIIIKR